MGNYLGQFTNELEPDDVIVEVAAAGPKNYGYRAKKGKVECKARGFRLNARGREQLNFEVLRDNVLKEIRHPLGQTRDIPVWNPHKIVRDNRNKKIAHGDVNQALSVGVRQEGGESRNIHDTSLRV